MYEGVVAPTGGRLLVERATTRRASQETLGGFSLAGWRAEPLSPTGWLATEYESFGAEGAFVQSYRIITLRPLGEDDRVRELVAVPPSDGTDPVRGAVTFRSVTDHRPGRRTVTIDGETAPITDVRQGGGVSVTRVLGWIALSGLIAGLVYVWLGSKRA